MASAAQLGKVLFVLCEEQIQKRQISDRDFFKGIKGDVFDSARDALAQELIHFFPSGQRTILLKTLAKAQEMNGILLQRVTKKLDGLDAAAMEKMIQAEESRIQRGLSESSITSAVPSALTRGTSASAD
jgi:hypothetical protein